MQQSDRIIEYLEAVRRQIRWKRAQSPVLEEIEDHITDQRDAFIADGFDEETAIDKAITEMGDPIVVGEQLDRTHRPKPDWFLLALISMMLFLGIAIQFLIRSTAFNGAVQFQNHMIWAGIGSIVMLAAYFADFTITGKYPRTVFGVLCVITVLQYLFGRNVNGISVYTVYFLLLFPTAFSGFIHSMRNKGYGGIIFCGAAFIIPGCISILIPSLTTLFLLCVSCLVILTAAVYKGWFHVKKVYAMLIIYIPMAVVLTLPFFMAMGKKYAVMRIRVIFNPFLDPSGAGYMGTMIQRLLTHSQFIGEGLPISGYSGHGVSKLLPGINTDFLLTYLIYRFGWIVLIGVITILAAFIIRAFVLCKKQRSVLGFLVSLAVILTFALQCIIYIASNLGFLLFSPLSLPLITYGGPALVANMCLIGFLLSVFRTGNLVKDKAPASSKADHFIQYNNGRIIIDLRK